MPPRRRAAPKDDPPAATEAAVEPETAATEPPAADDPAPEVGDGMTGRRKVRRYKYLGDQPAYFPHLTRELVEPGGFVETALPVNSSLLEEEK